MKTFKTLILIGLLCSFVAAQEKVSAELEAGLLEAECALDGSVVYAVIVDLSIPRGKEVPKIDAPAFPKSDAYDVEFKGREDSNESRVSISFNGRELRGGREQKVVFRYEIKPKSLGVLEIPSFDYEVLGVRHRIGKEQLRVLKESPGNRYLSVAVVASKMNPYVNQAVKIRYQLVSERQFMSSYRGQLPRLKVPWHSTPNGFYAEPLPEKGRSRDAIRVDVNGSPEVVKLELDRRATPQTISMVFERTIYPLAPGRINLGDTEAQVRLALQTRQRGFSREVTQSAAAVAKTEPLILEVRDAPMAGRPAAYSGLIGDFDINLNLGDTTLRAGDGVTVTLTIVGPGDLDSIQAPDIAKVFEEFNVYAPDRNLKDLDQNPGGKRELTYSWLLVPKTNKLKKFPAWEFAWFHPSSEKYRLAKIEERELTITGEIEDSEIFSGGAVAGRLDIKTLSEGIRPIRSQARGLNETGAAPSLWLLIAALVIPGLLFVGLNQFTAKKRRELGDVDLLRKRKASAEAERRLAEARALLGSSRGFHGKLSRTLAGFIGDKLSIPAASVSAASIGHILADRTVHEDLRAKVKNFLEELDHHEFGGQAPSEALQREDLQRAEALINELDRELRR